MNYYVVLEKKFAIQSNSLLEPQNDIATNANFRRDSLKLSP
jgi:hypothetical protein